MDLDGQEGKWSQKIKEGKEAKRFIFYKSSLPVTDIECYFQKKKPCRQSEMETEVGKTTLTEKNLKARGFLFVCLCLIAF